MKSRLTGKEADAGKDCRQEETEMTEHETAEWHHRLNEQAFEQAPWHAAVHGVTESDTTERLN